MLQSRRGFLIGAGAVLTTAFVAKAQSFVRETQTPLLTPPSDVRQTLYWYVPKGSEAPNWHMPEGSEAPMLYLNKPPAITPPPTWREYLDGVCAYLGRPATFQNVDEWRRYYDVEPDKLDLPMDPVQWRRDFDFVSGPSAQAFSLLAGIHFGRELGRHPGAGVPHINFNSPRIRDPRFFRSVNASDMLALSLLQARLIDLKLPIKIVKGIEG